MFRTIIEKELKTIIAGPKFVATFAVCSILILLSVFLGIQGYRSAMKSYHAATQLVEQELKEQRSWGHFNTQVFRKPDPMQVFVSGIANDIGRHSNVMSTESIKLTNSTYSDDPIFAVFRFIDFSFITLIVLSLFATLFTYDAINGERERGTLKLTFSHAVPRFKYIFAKFIGSWLGLVIPITIPILLSLLLVILFKIPFTGEHWIKLFILLAVSVLFFTFFIALGIFISAVTKRSAVSFLLLLVTWVVFVLIVPRISVMTAGKLVPVPSIAEIDGQIDGFSKGQWNKFTKDITNIWRERNVAMEGMSTSEKEIYRDEKMWQWMQEEDEIRKAVQVAIDEFSRTLLEDHRNRKAVQERLAFTLSRFSPASAYQLTTMNLAETDIHLKSRYETTLEQYKQAFVDYVEKKQKASGNMGGIRVTFNSETGLDIDVGRNSGSLDFSDMPRFQEIRQSFNEIIAPSIIDFSLLILYCIAALVGAFVVFLRYDVR